MTSQDEEYQSSLQNYRRRTSSLQLSIKQLLDSPLPYSWKIVESLLVPLLEQHTTDTRLQLNEISKSMQAYVKQVKTIPMLMYLYELKKNYPDIFIFYTIFWKKEYEEIGLQLGDLSIFTSWVSMHSRSQIVQESLWIVVRNFSLFVRQEHITFGMPELNNIIEWVTYFETVEPDTDKYVDSCELIKLAKETRLVSPENKVEDKTQHILFRKILEACSQCSRPSSNLFFFLYPMPFMENEITYFCQIYSDFITNLSQEGLCNIFQGLTSGALCKQSLLFLLKISHILANEEQFYKLRHLYQNFVLPILIRNGKSCNRVYEHVFEIAYLFVMGFLKHCDIGPEGIKCLVHNIVRIRNEIVQSKWIELCSQVCMEYPNLKPLALSMLRHQFGKDMQLSESEGAIVNPDCVWEITLRNGRKHKRYSKVASKLQGIRNRNNECYIISIVQGLHKNGFLHALLDKFKDQIKGGALKLLDELRILFGELSGTRPVKQNITVGYLKRLSPEPFNLSQHQEDAYEYLLKLLEIIELQIKKVPNMLAEFKSAFQIDEVSTIKCEKCSNSIEKPNNCYVLTIPSKKILSDQNEDPLPDFKCQKCNQKGYSVMSNKLVPQSRIMIVHINRFLHVGDGSVAKELSTQRILRKFQNYNLIGMVVHRGKKVDRGHYLYYHRVSEKRWALFNDNEVEEFELEHPFEEFESEWKAEMAPFILFYVRDQNN